MIREREHIVMRRNNKDGTETPLVMPNHSNIKSGTLRAICTQVGISRDEFLQAYNRI
ncbi:type II toxin-antitoxin system HicA family toxin [Crocosphaera sp. XPORK-15E]|uniref:type II toxin-antitoxin system HicA family toxin n=1 Tax=Crocosphaera sp. XPORK-15E TaxID=3110247 RepID=UPI002B1FC6CE|nr:type II toxin-antitoxin system HicA family toxin [Crocosphaera sp. XPORK-15E]MEA5534160.1 type II toxin-antitoxin system HicA family toxin [Crocosphaera sp. XPORK-15E]